MVGLGPTSHDLPVMQRPAADAVDILRRIYYY
jgi:hypothetical protein